MWEWMQDNAPVLSLVLSAAMLVVWIAYLQVFFTSFRRANRAVIHLSAAIEQDGDSRCLVTNMGAEVVYLLGIKADLVSAGESLSALMTDRVDDGGPFGGDLRGRTNQGPINGGEVIDIGSLRKICERVGRQSGKNLRPEDCDAVTITVVVAAQQAHRLMGGTKRFEIARDGDALRFHSREVLTRQITARAQRKALMKELTG